MFDFKRTDSADNDFITLVRSLDADLAERDGEDHSFYARYNKIDRLKYVVVAYKGENPAGCGAMKEFDPKTMEIKRMFTLPGYRGRGAAAGVLSELELWAAELSYNRCVLETGKRQPEAIGLYKKCGYGIIPNYGQYIGMDNSVCFEKMLR